MRRIFTFFLFAIVLGGYAMAYDFSAVCESGQTLYYNITSDTVPYTVEVAYNSNDRPIGSLIIPETVTYSDNVYSVTSIGISAFPNCSGLTSVTIPNSVTSIGTEAFYHCIGLTSIIISNSVTSIGTEAFIGCSGLTSVTIPNSVTSIGDYAFVTCTGLTEITIDEGNTVYDSRDNCNAIIETETNTLILGCQNTIIPNSVTEIGQYAFSGCSGLTSITIPNSVTSIGGSAFNGCSGLITVTIGEGVAMMYEDIFAGCTNLSVFNFNAVYCQADWGVFDEGSLQKITIGENVTAIPNYLFERITSFDSIICTAVNPPVLFGNSFGSDLSPLTPVIVPCGTVPAYQNYWRTFLNIQQSASCPTLYTITALSSNNAYGTVTGGGEYIENSTATLTATPSVGCHFVNWSDGSTENPRDVLVTEDATYFAIFMCDPYNPTIYNYITDTACGSYTWNGVTYTESGEHEQTFTAVNSADSIVTLTLTILPLPEPVITVDGVLDACNPETASVTLHTGEYDSYIWSNAATTESAVVTTPGQYYVEVVDSMGCHGFSESVTVGYSTALTETPQLRRVGANNTGSNIVQWTVANTEGIAGYEIYREDNVSDVYTLVQRVERPGVRSCTDPTADPSARAYRYKICAIDECGGMSPMSAPHKTMHLTINRGIGTAWNLIWSPYEGQSIRSYKIYRGTSMQDMVVIGEVPGDQTSYTDNSNPNNEGFFYKVVTVENTRSDDEEELGSNIVDNGLLQEYTIMAFSANPSQGFVTGGGKYLEGSIVTLTATSSEGCEFVSWNDGSTENPHYVTVTSDAMYIATFMSENGVDEFEATETEIFPNPATDILNITSSETISEIEIVNVMGQVVRRIEVNAGNAVCNVEGLKAGVYVVRIHAASATLSVRKFIKE